MAKDYMKFNEAARLEWRMLFFMRHNIIDSAIHKTIKYVLKILDEEPRQSPASAKSIFERLHRERINERKGFK